jgi:hypothetical protein
MHHALLMPIYHPTWFLKQLPIPPTLKFRQFRAAQGVLRKLVHMLHNSLHQRPRRGRVVQGDVVSNGV